MLSRKVILFTILLLNVIACKQDVIETPTSGPRFAAIDNKAAGIDFNNQLTYDQEFNIYTYRNFYNGGGVAIGDVNQDGWFDIYFTGNRVSNKLYLNNGDFTFEDITESAGVGGERSWSTGVCMADVNGDTFIDIYVCNSGDIEGDNKQNELFINNGDNTFTEMAEAYGLADQGYSTHAAFFDYDKDGDLDMYLLNNSYQAIGSFNQKKNQRSVRDQVGGDKFFKNVNGKFIDISEEAGIYGSLIGFGLGVTVGDMNNDSWQDIYVSNDFFERDYIYTNNGDGTFTENLEEQMRSISGASMGADIADINNDGQLDIFVTEMLPDTEKRIKTATAFEGWGRYQLNLSKGYYHQFTRNMLHLNNGDETYSEVGRLADVEATDWSWGSLMADYDNDGFKDIFIANGIYKDLMNQDYINYIANENTKDGIDLQQLIDAIPSNPVPNYLFQNNGKLQFENISEAAGIATPSFSNGAAYGDLDNDGDLDLIINNVNMPPFIYQNKSSGNNFIKLNLQGKGKNTEAVGSKVEIYIGDQKMMQEQMPIRGFQSSVDSRLNFGIGHHDLIDSIVISWPDNRLTKFTNVEANQLIVVDENASVRGFVKTGKPTVTTLFEKIDPVNAIDHTHKENQFVDFNRDRLLFHMLSAEGPRLAKADINQDDLEDVFIGGAKGEAGIIYLQNPNGSFRPLKQPVFEVDKNAEDIDAVFFDADQDGDMDLYVSSGGNEFSEDSEFLNDRLYLNNGNAVFKKSENALPIEHFESTSTIKIADFDKDGDEDIFIGGRLKPTLYGFPCNGYILENDGEGKFTDITQQIAPDLNNYGMITDAIWADIDNDEDVDLIVVGEWLPITIFKNTNNKFTKNEIPNSTGWWNTIQSGDFNKDGQIDFVLGNHGLNSRFKAEKDRPITMITKDFDQNGSVEQVISCFNGEASYPMALRHDLIQQIPKLKKKYVKYERYANQTIHDIFSPEELKDAIEHKACYMNSALLLNKKGSFEVKALPIESQYAPIYAILVDDFDLDGNEDILLGGNLYKAKPEVGRYDASYGLLLKGDGKSNFTPIPSKLSGLQLAGEVRDIQKVKTVNGNIIMIVNNNDKIESYTYYQ